MSHSETNTSVLSDGMKQVVQKNTYYYETKWNSVTNPSKENTWNWAAFFFTLFWLPYRKMYKAFAILAIIEILLNIPSYFVDIPWWTNIILLAAVSFAFGRFGNRMYYNHTANIVHKGEQLPPEQQSSFYEEKGGISVPMLVGCNVLFFLVFILSDIGLSKIPTEVNKKDVLRLSITGENLETFTDHPKWKYIKKEKRYDVIEFSGYDYSEKQDVRIIFHVFLDKQVYEWKEVYIDNKKLDEDEALDFEYWIDDLSAY